MRVAEIVCVTRRWSLLCPPGATRSTIGYIYIRQFEISNIFLLFKPLDLSIHTLLIETQCLTFLMSLFFSLNIILMLSFKLQSIFDKRQKMDIVIPKEYKNSVLKRSLYSIRPWSLSLEMICYTKAYLTN